MIDSVTTFNPYQALAGGALIGLAAVVLMAFLGRVAGISGILSGLLPPNYSSDKSWRIAFLAGLICSFLLLKNLTGFDIQFQPLTDKTLLLASGLIAGIGITFSSGCTSGHGICGLARISQRSIAATLTFMSTAIIVTFLIRHVF